MLQFNTLDELDHYNIDRKCWMCASYTPASSGMCKSKDMQQMLRDMAGVSFDVVSLGVSEKTDASLCSEFALSHEVAVMEELADMIQDAMIEAQRHAAHYNHLRRFSHA